VAAQDKSQQIRRYLEQYCISTGAPGISAAVAVKGEIVFSGGHGYADIENRVPATGHTVYRVASISKPIAAIGIMQLYEQGEIELDDHIQKYVPTFPRKKKGDITIKHLLTHSSGIRHYNDIAELLSKEHFDSLEEAITVFKEDTLLFKPGTKRGYSSYGFSMLQGVIESVSGLSIHDYMRTYVFEPAGMLSSFYDQPYAIVRDRARGYIRDKEGRLANADYTDVSGRYIGGGQISSVEDIARACIALDSGLLLKPETVEQMYKIYFRGDEEVGWGFSWRITTDNKGRRMISHSGGTIGLMSYVLNYTDENVVVAIITNQMFADVNPVAHAIVHLFLPPMLLKK